MTTLGFPSKRLSYDDKHNHPIQVIAQDYPTVPARDFHRCSISDQFRIWTYYQQSERLPDQSAIDALPLTGPQAKEIDQLYTVFIQSELAKPENASRKVEAVFYPAKGAIQTRIFASYQRAQRDLFTAFDYKNKSLKLGHEMGPNGLFHCLKGMRFTILALAPDSSCPIL